MSCGFVKAAFWIRQPCPLSRKTWRRRHYLQYAIPTLPSVSVAVMNFSPRPAWNSRVPPVRVVSTSRNASDSGEQSKAIDLCLPFLSAQTNCARRFGARDTNRAIKKTQLTKTVIERRDDTLVCRDSMNTLKRVTRRNVRIVAATVVVLIGSVWSSDAQEPYGGSVAIGGLIGGAVPIGKRLDNGFYTGASLLFSFGSHVALSAEAGANHVDVDRPGFRTDLMPRFADLNLLFHWRRGAFRPFISGGIGVYRYTITVSSEAFSDPALRNSLIALGLSPTSASARIETRHDEKGANLGGGYEYFFARRAALMMDIRAHVVRDFVQVAPFNGDFFDAAIGFRQYF